MKVLECKSIREKEVQRLREEDISSLTLAIIQIGKYKENELYLKAKEKLAYELGVRILSILFDEESSREEIIKRIRILNQDPSIHGIMIQKPILPKFFYQELVDVIAPFKDVEGLSSYHQKRWESGKGILPCTALAVLKVLEEYHVSLFDKKIVLLGKSELVGLPLYERLKGNNEVILCDSKTENIREIVQSADIVVVAIGHAHYLTSKYFSSSQVIIDVGTNYLDGKLVGDVLTSSLSSFSVCVTPVPGGIGMLTPVYLFSNLFMLAEYNKT